MYFLFVLWSCKPQSQTLGIDPTESFPDMLTPINVILVKLLIQDDPSYTRKTRGLQGDLELRPLPTIFSNLTRI